MNSIDRMHSKNLYHCGEPEIMKLQRECLQKQYEFNRLPPDQYETKGKELLKAMFAEFGEGSYIEPPLRCNFGGHFIHFGKNVYANFNLTCVDDTYIFVGDDTLIGPNVTISTTGHPVDPELRRDLYQFSLPVHIGRNCWIGAGVIILPGVSIGDNTVVAAGSVVSRDLPAGVVAMGTPCRPVREISEHDAEYFYRDRKINRDDLKLR